MIEGVKHIVAVASGKGGVGKSTVTANLALAMAAEGSRVGLVDADIYGPSQAQMLGIGEGVRPQMAGENSFKPLEAHGIQAMSMAFMVDINEPMVWRGPMVAGAFQQLLNREQADGGKPTVVAEPDGGISAIFRDIARAVATGVESQSEEGPSISFGD